VVADLVVGPLCGAIVRDRMWGHLVGLLSWGCCGCQDLEVDYCVDTCESYEEHASAED
jgi:hypothetical protein